MTNGPPPSSAGPSRPPQPPRSSVSGPGLPPQLPHQPLTQSYYLSASRNAAEPAPAPRYQPQSQWATSWSTGYSSSTQSTYRTTPVPQFSSPAAQQATYTAPAAPQYNPPPTQQTSYTPQSFSQRTRYTEPYPHSKVTPKLQTPPILPPQPQASAPLPAPAPPRSPSPPPPPPPKYRHWDRVIKDFLTKVGLKQALSGFEADMLVMNAEFERANVPDALLDVLRGIMLIRQGADLPELNRPLEERKLEYVHAANPSSQTITKSISSFLAQNRAKNDASNRAEFLQSLAEKRKRIDDEAGRANPDGISETGVTADVSSCARTDAKPVDRDEQMKYDIAKNSDGPLRRTTRHKAKAPPPVEAPPPSATPSTRPRTKSAARELKKAASPVVVKSEPDVKQNELHFGLDQRLNNIETHFSVRYVPAPPDNLLARLQFLEDHIIRLEKDYPPWAALHFNQPNRGWPPPPRTTPIIVPPHMRSSVSSTIAPPLNVGGMKTKNTGSSLQRAVMDQLAMEEARTDLAGRWK
ncbi:hypothetical protein B0H11DRAFT_2001188 [Mycena galericulata]|nr:hypothetical protein B0H11DRAFT_2001188 [Mycena galericulata]